MFYFAWLRKSGYKISVITRMDKFILHSSIFTVKYYLAISQIDILCIEFWITAWDSTRISIDNISPVETKLPTILLLTFSIMIHTISSGSTASCIGLLPVTPCQQSSKTEGNDLQWQSRFPFISKHYTTIIMPFYAYIDNSQNSHARYAGKTELCFNSPVGKTFLCQFLKELWSLKKSVL